MADDPITEPNETLDATELKAKYEAEVKNAAKQRQRAQAAEKQAAEAVAELATLQSEREQSARAAEQAKLEGEGKYKEALEKQREALAAEKKAEANRAESYAKRIKELVGTQALTKALGVAGVPSDRLSQAAQLLERRVRVEFDAEGNESVTVLDEAGSPMFVTGGNNATLEDLAKDFTAKNAWFRAPSGDYGSGFHPGGAGSLSIDDLDADKTGKKMADYIREHGQAAYQKLVDAKRRKKTKE